MLHLKLADGSDVYINALSVRYIKAHEMEGYCYLYFNTPEHVALFGDAKHVAETVHKGLRIIHRSQE